MPISRRSLRNVILAALGPTNALIFAGACAGKATQDNANAGGTTIGGATGGTGGTTAGSAPLSAGGSAGATTGSVAGGGSGGVIVASGGASTAGSGGIVNSGGAGTGGTGGAVTMGGGYNCNNPGVGICCDYDMCFTAEELAAYLQQHPVMSGVGGGTAGEAGQGGDTACHEIQRTWLCGSFRPGVTEKDGKCCYVVNEGSCCGRPFIVAGAARQSELALGTTWSSYWAEAARDASLSDSEAAELASAWAADALLEHASVAAFARFALELLNEGAPADLVEAAQRAGLDEVAHARACFGLASRFAGRALGPGPLPMNGLALAQSPLDLAMSVFREGCVGETLAAALADAQLSRVVDPQCRAALEMIARDEAQHAALAWRTVQSIIEREGLPVARALLAELSALSEVSDVSAEEPQMDAARWNHYGRLTRAQERVAIAETWRDVIAPAAKLLLKAWEFPADPTAGNALEKYVPHA